MNKICTNLEQSKRLQSLGIDIKTADMDYIPFANNPQEYDCIINVWNNEHEKDWIPAWSLAALLDVYPMVVGRDMDMYCCWQNSKNLHSKHYDNPVDACYEMILKLHELKRLQL